MSTKHIWRPRPDLRWCPSCGFGACIETCLSVIGERWVCISCGLMGRFGSGLSDPSEEQPEPDL